jgi:hypothetical protein
MTSTFGHGFRFCSRALWSSQPAPVQFRLDRGDRRFQPGCGRVPSGSVPDQNPARTYGPPLSRHASETFGSVPDRNPASPLSGTDRGGALPPTVPSASSCPGPVHDRTPAGLDLWSSQVLSSLLGFGRGVRSGPPSRVF